MPQSKFARWDVVTVPFPFTEGIGGKRRPALIVSSKSLASHYRFYWLLMITSVVKPAWKGDVEIKDLALAGLRVHSVIRTAKITTLQEDRIFNRIGRIASSEIRLVTAALKDWLTD
jgi:mRNA interferase MazF